MTTPSAPPDIRQQLGDRYAIERELGRGGTAFTSRAIFDSIGPSRSKFFRRTSRVTLRCANGFFARRAPLRHSLTPASCRFTPSKAAGGVSVSCLTRICCVVVATESPKPTRATLGNLAMAASELSPLGVSFILLVRSPFRMPPDERFFRIVWLGPLGRGFLRFSSRGVTRRSTGATGPSVARIQAATGRSPASDGAVAPRAPTGAVASDRMASLEARVAALEKWRDGSKP
jgi:hypothetical protein